MNSYVTWKTIKDLREKKKLTQKQLTKEHYISFPAYVTCSGMQSAKLYPEQAAECRFRKNGYGKISAYCNRHGLYAVKV